MMEQLLNHGDQLPPLSAKYPWMVISQDDPTRDQIFYAMQDDDPQFGFRCRIPEMVGKRIRGFYHGWVVLSNNVKWSLWNPSTSKLIHLPPLKNIFKDEQDSDDIIIQCCLSSPPNLPGSLLLITTNKRPSFVFCRLDPKIKKLKWTEMSYAKQLMKISIDGRLLHSLTCCNGKIYALNTDGTLACFVLNIDFVVKDKEVVIKLLPFGSCPIPRYHHFRGVLFSSHFLKGSSTVLFCIIIDFNEEAKKTVRAVTLFRLDTTSINWVDLEGLQENWDMTNKRVEEVEDEDFVNLDETDTLWEEMSDLKDAIFFVDLGRDCSITYSRAISSELGGYIHIREEIENIMYSYHVNYKTIVPCSMPTPVMLTSHVLIWEFRLEDDHGEDRCTVDSKHEEDVMMAARSIARHKVKFNESLLLNLPFDLLEMIMKRCVCLEYLNLRATCKQCHIAAPSIQWSNKTESQRLQTYSLVSPWLMVVDENQGILTFIDPMLGDNYFMKNSKVSIVDGSNHLYCSKFGWLLFESRELKCLVFFNPFTNDLRKLPKNYYMRTSLCFSAPPTSSNCMVVGFTDYVQSCIHILYVNGDPTRWHMFNLGRDINSIRFPTFYGQDLYALSNEGGVILFKDLGGEDYSGEFINIKAPESSYKSAEAHFYLMDCDQHILLVIVGKSVESSVEIFKFDDDTKEWEKIDDLGKHMIYICDTTCLCIEAKTPEMENKVYFPCLHPTNGKIVLYSLETNMFHTFNGKTIQEHLGGLYKTVRHHNLLAWIEPRWY